MSGNPYRTPGRPIDEYWAKCDYCRDPMHPAQNAKRVAIGRWICMKCYLEAKP